MLERHVVFIMVYYLAQNKITVNFVRGVCSTRIPPNTTLLAGKQLTCLCRQLILLKNLSGCAAYIAASVYSPCALHTARFFV